MDSPAKNILNDVIAVTDSERDDRRRLGFNALPPELRYTIAALCDSISKADNCYGAEWHHYTPMQRRDISRMCANWVSHAERLKYVI